jgi:IclR helix-turn-helix domain
MSAQAFTPTTFAIPISSGLLAHCQKIGIAVWVFLWMIDRTTKEVITTDGYSEGLVYGGKPVRARDIAQDLGMATRTVHAHLEVLIQTGYLRRINYGDGLPSGYAVARSKKWRNRPTLASGEDLAPTPLNPANPRRKTAGGSLNPALPSPNSALPSLNPAPYKEDITRTIQGLNIVEEKSFDANLILVSPTLGVEKNLEHRVKEGWDYFLDRTSKSSAQYLFSPERQKQGLKGFESLVAFVKRCKAPGDPHDAASRLFRVAVDRLADSPFHNGENNQRKRYLDWHQLFRSEDFPAPTKLVEYWLDDSRWTK